MVPSRRSAAARPCLLIAIILFLGQSARAQDEPPGYKDGFEGPKTRWQQEGMDVRLTLLAHDIVQAQAHDGVAAERFRFIAGAGSNIYVSYPLPKTTIDRDPRVVLHLKSPQAGYQLLARIVLPADRNPDTDQPSFLTIAGPTYAETDRWQALEIADFADAMEQQLRLLRLRNNREINVQGAYLERLILNLYTGPGESEVFLDDLLLTPPPEQDEAAEAESTPTRPGAEAGSSPRVELTRGRPTKDGYPWFFRAIEAPGADPRRLRPAAFDVWSFPAGADPKIVASAHEAGFLLMPHLGIGDDLAPVDPEEVAARIRSSPYRDDAVFWQVGAALGSGPSIEGRQAERTTVREILRSLRGSEGRAAPFVTSSIAGDFPLYGQPPYLDLFGVDIPTWGASRSPLEYFEYLRRHRALTTIAIPQALYWATVPAAPPAGLGENIWGPYRPPEDGRPQVQPEQMRIYAYAAMMAGYRGLLVRGDADLTQPAGQARLIEATLLNAEIDLFESILADGVEYQEIKVYPPDPAKIQIYNPMAGGFSNNAMSKLNKHIEVTPHPSVRAVGIGFEEPETGPRGLLILLADLAPNAQWQPPQMAATNLKIRVPTPSRSQRAYEVTLGGVRPLKMVRGVGGQDITLPYFNSTAAILVTSDQDLINRVTAAVNRVAPRAVGMVIEQADVQNRWVRGIHARLVDYNRDVKESAERLALADRSLASATDMLKRADWWEAWNEARSVRQILRVVMTQHFAKALNDLVEAENPGLPPLDSRKRPQSLPQILTPVSSAPLVAFNTLPEAYIWNDRIRHGKAEANLLADGEFEPAKSGKGPDWWRTNLGRRDQAVLGAVQLIKDKESNSNCLRLRVGLAPGEKIEDQVPFLDQPYAAVQTAPVPVLAGHLYRIGVRLRSAYTNVPGGLGVVVEDTIGGEALQLRTDGAIPDWQELIFYRLAPADGELALTIGMAGFGDLLVDNITIRPLMEAGDGSAAPGLPPVDPSLARPDTTRRVR